MSSSIRGLDPSYLEMPPPSPPKQPGFAELLREELFLDHANTNKHLLVQVEQGPELLGFLVMAGALVALLDAGLVALVHARQIGVLAVYQAVFALMTLAFEAPPTWVHRFRTASRFQEVCRGRVAFLCDMQGRAVFYLFQGTLWLVICMALHVRNGHLFCGVHMVSAGILTSLAVACDCTRDTAAVGEEAELALGPNVGRTENTQERAQRLQAMEDEQELTKIMKYEK